jgi:hypothetical protein
METEEWGKPPPPKVRTGAEVIREYRLRRRRYASRQLPALLGLTVVAAVAALLAYAKLKLVRQQPLLLLVVAALFGRPILSRLLEALRYRPYCPACELGQGKRGAKGLVCSQCGAPLA